MSLELITRCLPPGITCGNDRTSQVPGRPQCPFARALRLRQVDCSRPGDALQRRFSEQPRGPCVGNDKGTHKKQPFEAQLHGFQTRCLRFVTFVTSCNARLASGRWSNITGRAFQPQGHYQRFQIHIMLIIPLRQASWRNPNNC